MKTLLRSILLLTSCFALPLSAQEKQGLDLTTVKTNVLYLGWGAQFNGIGLGYERCLSHEQQLYLQTGFGFGYSSMSWFGVVPTASGEQQLQFGNLLSYSYTLPVGMTYLVGHRRSKLELGAGMATSYQHSVYKGLNETTNKVSANLFGHIGWRWQARSGFLFRIGLSPMYSLNKDNVWANAITFGDDDNSNKRFALSSYLSFGWAF